MYFACCCVCCCSRRLVQCLCSAAAIPPLQQQQSLWLGLLHEVLLLSPSHAGMAALRLPLVAAVAGAGGSSNAECVLLLVWQAVGLWTAKPGVQGRPAAVRVSSSSSSMLWHAVDSCSAAIPFYATAHIC
jgi:hypothetical protein